MDQLRRALIDAGHEPSTLREELMHAGLLRPGEDAPLTPVPPDESRPVLRLDDATRRAAAKLRERVGAAEEYPNQRFIEVAEQRARARRNAA